MGTVKALAMVVAKEKAKVTGRMYRCGVNRGEYANDHQLVWLFMDSHSGLLLLWVEELF